VAEIIQQRICDNLKCIGISGCKLWKNDIEITRRRRWKGQHRDPKRTGFGPEIIHQHRIGPIRGVEYDGQNRRLWENLAQKFK
jgi:hypothetical protein